MKKILGLTVAALLVMGLVGGGTWAYFSDVETSTGNILTAGTLDLDIASGDADVTILQASITDVAPGSSASDSVLLHKTGTVAGELDINFGAVDSDDNGLIVDAETVGGPDATDGVGNGELDANTWMAFWLDYQNLGNGWSASDVGLKSNGTTYTYAAPTTGVATGGSLTTVVKASAGWTVDQYKGYPVTVTAKGTGVIVSNTADTLTVATKFSSAVVNSDNFSIASGPHYDLASAYSGDLHDAVVANMADDYDFTIEWVVPVTVGNVIMSDTVYFDLSFILEQIGAD